MILLLPAALEVLIHVYEVTFFMGQYDSTIISFCIRIGYSTSMTQKHSLDRTLVQATVNTATSHCSTPSARQLYLQAIELDVDFILNVTVL